MSSTNIALLHEILLLQLEHIPGRHEIIISILHGTVLDIVLVLGTFTFCVLKFTRSALISLLESIVLGTAEL